VNTRRQLNTRYNVQSVKGLREGPAARQVRPRVPPAERFHASRVGFRAFRFRNMEVLMRGILLWVLGIPIPIIILLYLFHVI
jgi:hypothetical protein